MSLHPSDPIYVVATTVSLGFVLLLFSLLVPGEPVAMLVPVSRDEVVSDEVADFTSSFAPPPMPPPPRVIVEAVPPPVAKYEWTPPQVIEAPPAVAPRLEPPMVARSVKTPSPAAERADYRAFMATDEDTAVEIEPVDAQEIAHATVRDIERVAAPQPPARVEREVSVPRVEPELVAAPRPERVTSGGAKQRKMTWTSLVDDSAEELDMVTRLRIIEALGLVGGSWSREILARAYEQELDATVRGAIFLALRDSKSAA